MRDSVTCLTYVLKREIVSKRKVLTVAVVGYVSLLVALTTGMVSVFGGDDTWAVDTALEVVWVIAMTVAAIATVLLHVLAWRACRVRRGR